MEKEILKAIEKKTCKFLEEMSQRDFTSSIVDVVSKGMKILKYTEEAMESEYSEGDWSAEGSYRGGYDRGSSYARRRRDSRGRYAREGSYARESSYGYSEDGDIVEEMLELMKEASPKDKEMIRKKLSSM